MINEWVFHREVVEICEGRIVLEKWSDNYNNDKFYSKHGSYIFCGNLFLWDFHGSVLINVEKRYKNSDS